MAVPKLTDIELTDENLPTIIDPLPKIVDSKEAYQKVFDVSEIANRF